MGKSVETVVIGGGQAGLSISYHLARRRREHVVLEQGRVGETWRSKRWDSFTLVTPNWMNQLPDFPYQGPDPDGFLPRNQISAYLEDYAETFGLPVRSGIGVTVLKGRPNGRGYEVETTEGGFLASNVVVATGAFRQPKVPGFSAEISVDIGQLPSSEYKNPNALPAGNVLIVGSGQSGCQIAEELNQSGRRVYQCTSAPVRAGGYTGATVARTVPGG